MKNADVLVCTFYSEGNSTTGLHNNRLCTQVITTLASGIEEILGSYSYLRVTTKYDEVSICEEARNY